MARIAAQRLLVPVLATALAMLASGCSGSSAPAAAPSIAGVKTYSGLSHAHLKKGEAVPSYPQSPPVGGTHSPAWLICQAYPTELPLQNAVHSLEHGGVWLTYLPTTSPADIAALEGKTVENKEFVMVSPFAGQASPVVVTTWGLQLEVPSASDPRIDAFIRTYAGGDQGGEKGVGCASNGLSLAKALEYDATQQ